MHQGKRSFKELKEEAKEAVKKLKVDLAELEKLKEKNGGNLPEKEMGEYVGLSRLIRLFSIWTIC
jgi:hypothetical protein